MINREEIATYTEINRVCLRDGYAPLLRVWYWQRHKDNGGKGWFYIHEFLSHIEELGLTSKRAEQILRKGLNMFWWQSGDVIRLVGLGRLDAVLNLDTNEGYRVMIPAEAFQDLQTFKAYAYASWFARSSWKTFSIGANGFIPTNGKVIARETLEKLFGITRHTQRKYEEITQMWVEEQVAVFKSNNEVDATKIELTEGKLDGEMGGVWQADVDGDGETEIIRQIPNRYTTTLSATCHRKRIKSDGSSINRGAEPNPKMFHRAYFYKMRKAVDAFTSGKTRNGIAYVRTGKTITTPHKCVRVYDVLY